MTNAAPLHIALETSTHHGRIAVAVGEHVVVHEAAEHRRHASLLLPVLREALNELGRKPAEVRAVFFSQGPGSFTGLRVAATIARMLHSITGCAVIAVPTMEVIAQNALDATNHANHVAVMLDAKRDQVYAAAFRRADASGVVTLAPVAPAALHNPTEFVLQAPKPIALLGEGLRKHAAAADGLPGVAVIEETQWAPRAEAVLKVGRRMLAEGRTCPPAEITPLYIRPPECEEAYERNRAAAMARRAEQ